jgi:hypothetical protein
MLRKTTVALAFALATAPSAHAATKQQSVQPARNGYDARGAYVGAESVQPARNVYDAHGAFVGADPDAKVRFELHRDSDRGYK